MASPIKAKELHAFTPATFVENIAVRSNGHLLLSTFEQSRLYGLDPSTPGAVPHVLAEFEGATALTGIAEISPNVFAIGGGVKGGSFKFDGDMSLYTVDLNGDTASTKLIAKVPGSKKDVGSGLNGMCPVPGKPHIVLGADSWTGEIHRIDTQTGKVDIAFGDPTLQLAEGDSKTVPIGVNGIRAVGKHLYFANSAQGLFGRFPISVDGDKAGEAEIIARFAGEKSIAAAYDDFAVAPDESVAYIATHPNRVMKVDIRTGEQEILFEGSDEVSLKAPTSAALSKDGKTLYVSTGGIDMRDGKMERTGAQVVQIQVEG